MKSLIIVVLKTLLNLILYRDRRFQKASQRLVGKTLTLCLSNFSFPLVLLFHEEHVDILSNWQGHSDCTIIIHLKMLYMLHNRQKRIHFMRTGEIEVKGDLKIVQQFWELVDLTELDPAEYLAPWVGDIVAQVFNKSAYRILYSFKSEVQRCQDYLSQTLTEEWRIAPCILEFAWFSEEIEAIERSLEALDERLAQLEAK